MGKDLELLVGDQALELGVLLLELAQPLRVLGLHPAVLVAPAMQRVLGDLERLRDLGRAPALAEHPLGLAQLPDHLVRSVTLCLHRA